MNIEILKQSGRIIFETITGSTAYGLNTPESDIDMVGVYSSPISELLSLKSFVDEVSDEKHNIKYYSLKKYFSLAKDCNPNIIELLFMPKDMIRIKTDKMNKIIENRNLFISKKAKFTHAGYAYAQIKKAKGENKWINNEKSKEKPKKEDFVYILNNLNPNIEKVPGARPVKYKEFIKTYPHLTLNKLECSFIEHSSNMYRLYYVGDEARGVFRNGNLTCENITVGMELDRFIGLMIFNQPEYDQALKDWHAYWEWFNNRNKSRWKDQENKLIDYDCKNMMHCVRLLHSGINILVNGEPIIRFQGQEKDFLLNIRNAKYTYKYLVEYAETKMKELDELYRISQIQHSVDIDKIDNLYLELIHMKESK